MLWSKQLPEGHRHKEQGMCKIILIVLFPRITGLRIMGQKLHPDNPPVASPSMSCLSTGIPTAWLDWKVSPTLGEKYSLFLIHLVPKNFTGCALILCAATNLYSVHDFMCFYHFPCSNIFASRKSVNSGSSQQDAIPLPLCTTTVKVHCKTI